MKDVTDLLSELVAIDSVNPSLVPGGAGEGEAAAFVAGWARDAGLRGRRSRGHARAPERARARAAAPAAGARCCSAATSTP